MGPHSAASARPRGPRRLCGLYRYCHGAPQGLCPPDPGGGGRPART